MSALLLAALLAAADGPEPAPAAPTGPPPRILNASIKGDQLHSTQVVQVVVPIVFTEKVVINGQATDVTKTKNITQSRTQEESWDLKKATLTTAGGKKLDLDDLRKQFAKPRPVILSTSGKAIEAGYLKLFDKDAIVIVVPLAEKP